MVCPSCAARASGGLSRVQAPPDGPQPGPRGTQKYFAMFIEHNAIALVFVPAPCIGWFRIRDARVCGSSRGRSVIGAAARATVPQVPPGGPVSPWSGDRQGRQATVKGQEIIDLVRG